MESDKKEKIQDVIIYNYLNKSKITDDKIILIDGSILEGGGQILRISVALSLILKKEIKIEKIRAGRDNPGLKNQHLASILFLKEIFNSKVEGANLKSQNVSFAPISDIEEYYFDMKSFSLDCGSAGSIGLMIQQILPCFVFVNQSSIKIQVKFKGGTLVNSSPSTFYLNDILRVILNQYMKINFEVNVERHGIFPVGGGMVNFEFIRKNKLENKTDQNSIENKNGLISNIEVLNRGNITKIVLRVMYTNNIKDIFNLEDYMKNNLKEIKRLLVEKLKSNYLCQDIDYSNYENLDFLNIETNMIEISGKKGYTLFTNANFYYENTIITAESLFSGKKSITKDERIEHQQNFMNEVEMILKNKNICFDEYTVDHLIIFMGLAKGKSRISVGKISLHTYTAIEILKKFIPCLEVNITKILEDTNDSNIIEIEGIGV